MSDGYEVDPARLAEQGAQLDPLAGRIASIHQTLSAALAESGACWGTDAVGQSFAGAHAGPADSTLTQLGGLPDKLGSVGTRFTATAARYEGDDEHGATRLRAAGPDAEA
jgi:hypothetical protein